MTRDVFGEDGERIGEDHRDDFDEDLEKQLSDYPEMRMIIGPLLKQRHERDSINRNRKRKGDNLVERIKLNEELKDSGAAFFLGLENPWAKGATITNLKDLYLKEQELDFWFKNGQKYKIELEKIPASKQDDIWKQTQRCLMIIIQDKTRILDKYGKTPPYGD